MRIVARRIFLCLLTVSFLLPASLSAQTRKKDKAIMQDRDPGYYYGTIVPALDGFDAKPVEPRKRFKAYATEGMYPTDPKHYEKVWHFEPVSQGRTGTCWCFSTSSFYESEVKRAGGKEVKLSEMYTVYWEYVERARYFVQHRGQMFIGEGSETNAVARMMEKYGAVPVEVYTGLKPGQPFHTHREMFDEIEAYLKGVESRGAWNEEEVVATTRAILEHHMGAIPTEFEFEGKTWTPMEFMQSELKIEPDAYVNFMSLMEYPYYQKAEYKVPDNWWHSDDFYNVPLDVFMEAIKSSLVKGYTVAIGGDVSEAGFNVGGNAAIVPTFDIPSEYIDENARQMRFLNGSTTDDHAMHVVGWAEKDGATWFLVKDSGSGSRNCGENSDSFGYYYFHEDYVKLKMMNFTVHRDAVKDLLKKMK